jgi:hypothetical protein
VTRRGHVEFTTSQLWRTVLVVVGHCVSSNETDTTFYPVLGIKGGQNLKGRRDEPIAAGKGLFEPEWRKARPIALISRPYRK